ncbi:MAG: DnaJ domain-containing protein [Pseudomonadota bacterium]|nr:DnaJ domain-containing protein [Pseudomonadota bacterium]
MSKLQRDPYEVLGVARDGRPEDIKLRYRAWAKRMHPDVGGSREAFDELNEAYELLSDPERRAKYDAIGDLTETTADTAQARTMTQIAGLLQEVVGDLTTRGKSVRLNNVIERMIGLIERNRKARAIEVAKMLALSEALGEVAARVVAPDGADLIGQMAQHLAKDLKAETKKAEELFEAEERALELLRQYGYQTDAPMPYLAAVERSRGAHD